MTIDHSQLPQSLSEVIEASQTSMVRIKLDNASDALSLTDSKIGGLGYLPEDKAYPYTDAGNPLSLLIQINFEQLADNIDVGQLAHPLPTSGILQIYIDATDDVYGADYDNPTPSDAYQVRFWKDISAPVNTQALREAKLAIQGYISDDEYYPPFDVHQEIALKFVPQTQSCSPSCIDFSYYLKTIDDSAQETEFFDYLESLGIEDIDDIHDVYNEIANAQGHQLLGYPYFTQTDPRTFDDAIQQHILLLQIDTDDDFNISWGDCGVAHFFITPKALANEDFSGLIYHWDCY
ncbi:YwqG family protein [Psychrobacter sp. FDAARGOS_221]|uniref:YwqG family protein n=1 Tax=Psychrobacter sp. FDAARGOS_221 TaxID=1975705 RepID=UPI000BB56942|nr:DUF1963 domain-containing protein [Psychrobacter sp. FDAARGOS_221]PNK59897.1 DUF1963 domain-containing protein [Psychrobacter sp. FDAARGOS_221]